MKGKVLIIITAIVLVPTMFLISWAWKTIVLWVPEYNEYVPLMIYDSRETCYPSTIDFDNDLIMVNNREHYVANVQPSVYCRAVERENYWVYHYMFYYAFQQFINYHEHDVEQAFVFVSKTTQEPVILASSAHGRWWNCTQTSSRNDLHLFVETAHAMAYKLGYIENGYSVLCDGMGRRILPADFEILDVQKVIEIEDSLVDAMGYIRTNEAGDRVKFWWNDQPSAWANPEVVLANYPALQKLLEEI